jgi:endonuclease/exonuclease/phosphatase family metal-dependent hydrolase
LRALVATIVLAAGTGAGAGAQGFGVATWNLNWLMDEGGHARWIAACDSARWPAGVAAPGLPYCDVHNGMAFPPDACASDRDDWPRAARYPDDHPCRETQDLAQPARYARKLDALRAMWARLDAMGVRLVALQDVQDAGAVRAILPPRWSVATTRELAGAPVIAQHVGVAWQRGTNVRQVALVPSLADSGVPDRPLRPGLAFTVDVGGKPVRVLVVHLKAGCRSRNLDIPLGARDGVLDAARQDTIATDCALLRFQLPALEAWIDGNASRDFALLGDFNRTLLREPVAESRTYKTRVDGTSAGDPLLRDTRTRAVFPEINDSHPPGAVIWRSRFADQGRNGAIPKGSSGDCTIAGTRGDLTHDGIDHILLSESLKSRLVPGALTMRAINYTDGAGAPLRGGPDVALPSDHCPHVADWIPLRGADK